MAEAEENAESQQGDALLDAGDDAVSAGNESSAEAAETVASGPGKIRRVLNWLWSWHPFILLGVALVLAFYAWSVYPEPEAQQAPPADLLYSDGLDRLYRVINPDLPLLAATPADEALAARNALLNLFVFHRGTLANYPQFVNPHLLLGEANRLLAEFNPSLADKYYQDAGAAYSDAALWESRENAPGNQAVYDDANFLGGAAGLTAGSVASEEAAAFLAEYGEEIALRRSRRNQYIRYRRAEADVHLGHPELARPVLEEIQREIDGRRREQLRWTIADGIGVDVPPRRAFEIGPARRAFEIGPDEYDNLDLLLARTYDGLGLQEQARSWYLRYQDAMPGGRDHAFVVNRLADISMTEGEVYRRADPIRAEELFAAAAERYRELSESPAATPEQHGNAIAGLAKANSFLAGLIPDAPMTGVDELSAFGRRLRGWLEDFSGQPLPRRTLAVPSAIGNGLVKPEMILPGPHALAGTVAGRLVGMAGGGVTTPREKRRQYLTRALEYYDQLAAMLTGTEAGDRARVQAAKESWNLELKEATVTRLERMFDPLASEELVLAARLGLARAALDRGNLRNAQTLILGGYYHPAALWFTPSDADWRRIASRLGNPLNRAEPGALRRIWEILPDEGKEVAGYAASGRRLDDDYVARFLRSLNMVLRNRDMYRGEDFRSQNRNAYLSYLLARAPELLTAEDVVWRNRLLLEEAWPYELAQKGARSVVGFEPFPPGIEIAPWGMVSQEEVKAFLTSLGAVWSTAAAEADSPEERLRMLMESVEAYRAALDSYQGDAGEILYDLARNYEAMAEIRELRGEHSQALILTAAAGQSYFDVSLRARGAPREMDALLLSGDAFFRAGLLERTVESQNRFLERFGYTASSGSDAALSVVRAENLLGRAYWFMDDTDKALDAFRRNIGRRTPDRFKSIYYIGRVLMDKGVAANDTSLLGDANRPLPEFDRNGDPVIESALQAFNFLRQSQGINPTARAWRWATFDLARLQYLFAERSRREWERRAATEQTAEEEARPWLGLYDRARVTLTEALERYPLRRNGGIGLSVRVEPEDYADVMASRFEAEYMLAETLLVLAEARKDATLRSLARAHLENLRDPRRYAAPLFDETLDRFQLNAAVIRDEIEGGDWDARLPLPRTRLGDDEGPTHSPRQLRASLRNALLRLANQYFLAGEEAAGRQTDTDDSVPQEQGTVPGEAESFYRRSYEVYQSLYDRFGVADGTQAMVGMGDALSRMGLREEAANHYRMAVNIAELQPDDVRADGRLDIGPAFWGRAASERLTDLQEGYRVP